MTAFAPDPTVPLVVDNLSIGYRRRRRGKVEDVVHDVSFTVPHGSTVSLVGQSGSGKSTIARSVAGLLPHNGALTGGSVKVVGRDVTRFTTSQWRPLRGSAVGFVPQDPLSSLDPLQRIGVQIAGALAQASIPRSEIPARVIRLLEHVGIRDAKARSRAFPHELSGGQLQRVLIAIAIAADPALLIADEPTSALDVTVQKRILDLIDGLREELGLGVLFITHDLALAQERSDAIVVLKDGIVREQGPSDVVLVSPQDRYTITLLSDAPAASPDRYRDRVRQPEASARDVVTVSNVSKTFGGRARSDAPTRALDDVSLTLRQGSIHALVGESGSGKTTLARIIAGLTGFDSGRTVVGGRELSSHETYANPFARTLQLVYQNPLSAVDPRYSVRRIVEEPLRIHGIGDARSRRARVADVLDQVALPESVLGRTAREISGGQRQRVALARTLILAPDVLVLDEPTSALDVTVQAQIVELLLDLRELNKLSYLFISHDLALVRQIADTISVLEVGSVVETGSAHDIFSNPQHAYTRELLNSVPRLERKTDAAA
ncbi:MAG: ABC transporter ATP-binding protein [Mycetocola sp.]